MKMKHDLIKQDETQKYPSAPRVLVENGVIGPDGRHYGDYEEFVVDATSATATGNEELAFALLNQLARAQGVVSEKSTVDVNRSLSLLSEFGCKNIQETSMAIHIIALHSHASRLLMKAANETHPELQKGFYIMALKLSKAFGTMMETFHKYKRNGTYKMQIEHLHVHNGGQAIVGTINQQDTGGRARDE